MQCWLPFLAILVAITTYELTEAYNVVCYYQSWAIYRPGSSNYQVEDIDTSLCTHIVYAFGGVTSSGTITIGDQNSDINQGGFRRFNALRNRKSSLKTMLALGGGGASSKTFSDVVNNANTRSNFANNIVNFLKEYGFNGIDIDWEFPAQWGGKASDKSALIELFKLLRSKFDANGFILSVAVSAGVDTINSAYDVPHLAQYVDFINVMTYDIHGSWDSVTGENTPLYAGPNDKSDFQHTLNVDYIIKYWIQKGAPASKLNLGMGSYGNSFTLKNPSNNGVGAPASGGGKPGPYTQGAGVLSYLEICEGIKSGQWHFNWNADQKTCYAVNGNQWVGYDNMGAIRVKSWYIVNNGLGGAMIWSIDMDDFKNSCGDGKYPLMNSIKSILKI